jgi:hypothetical protein
VEAYPADRYYGLIAKPEKVTPSGAGQSIRGAVDAVRKLQAGGVERPGVVDVSKHLDISKPAASRRVNTAIGGGWLVNDEPRRGRPYRLDMGAELPPDDGIPHPDTLAARPLPITPALSPPLPLESPRGRASAGASGKGNAVTQETGGYTPEHEHDTDGCRGNGHSDVLRHCYAHGDQTPHHQNLDAVPVCSLCHPPVVDEAMI